MAKSRTLIAVLPVWMLCGQSPTKCEMKSSGIIKVITFRALLCGSLAVFHAWHLCVLLA